MRDVPFFLNRCSFITISTKKNRKSTLLPGFTGFSGPPDGLPIHVPPIRNRLSGFGLIAEVVPRDRKEARRWFLFLIWVRLWLRSDFRSFFSFLFLISIRFGRRFLYDWPRPFTCAAGRVPHPKSRPDDDDTVAMVARQHSKLSLSLSLSLFRQLTTADGQ